MGTSATVCVIDDDELVRRTICSALEAAGYATVQAEDGIEGLKTIERTNARVAVIDIIMPSREGLDIIVEATRRFPSLKILAVSGGGRIGPTEYLEMALQLGAHDMLSKPFHNKDLIQKVKQLSAGA
jgi:DNA-binding response OmpR family regulator